MRVKASYNAVTKEFVASGKQPALAILEPDNTMVLPCKKKSSHATAFVESENT